MLRNYGKHQYSKSSKVYLLRKGYEILGMVLLKDILIITSIHAADQIR